MQAACERLASGIHVPSGQPPGPLPSGSVRQAQQGQQLAGVADDVVGLQAAITADDLVILASESGVIPVPEEKIKRKSGQIVSPRGEVYQVNIVEQEVSPEPQPEAGAE